MGSQCVKRPEQPSSSAAAELGPDRVTNSKRVQMAGLRQKLKWIRNPRYDRRV